MESVFSNFIPLYMLCLCILNYILISVKRLMLLLLFSLLSSDSTFHYWQIWFKSIEPHHSFFECERVKSKEYNIFCKFSIALNIYYDILYYDINYDVYFFFVWLKCLFHFTDIEIHVRPVLTKMICIQQNWLVTRKRE